MYLKDYSDEQLFELLKAGLEKALEELIARYWESMYKMVVYTFDDPHLAEDIVQEMFIQIWDGRQKINLKHSLKAYLFASTRYAIYRQVKKERLEQKRLDGADFQYIENFNPQKKLEYNELLIRLEDSVNKLPSRCREVYNLSRVEQLSHKEIAAKLNLSTKTVENQLTIALRKLRSGLGRLLALFFLIF